MDYYFNYNYLREFMVKNGLTKKDILEAIESQDYQTLNKWLDGKVAIGVCALLRLCNYYNEPLENFFSDKEGLPVRARPGKPGEGVQTEPTDGYGIRDGRGRGIVETHVSDRRVSSAAQAKAVAAGLERQQERGRMIGMLDEEGVVSPTPSEVAMSREMEELRVQVAHMRELKELEDRLRAEFAVERMRLIDVIENQQKEVSRLYVPEDIGMVAEKTEEE